MIPAAFDYHAPKSLQEAADLLQTLPEAKVLAGGMSLIPAMKHRLALPPALVDIGRIGGLDQVKRHHGHVTLGPCTSHAAIAAATELEGLPILGEAARLIGDAQVRNRGTIGGSLVHADPAGDWPAVFLALDGEARVYGARGERNVAARDFFTGMLTSAVGRDEILTRVSLPFERRRAGTAYLKLRQPASGFAIVGVAVQVALDRKGRCEQVAVAMTGLNPVPFRAASVEEKLRGEELTEELLRDACAHVDELDPMEDIHASAEYRRHLASVYARRAIVCARERAQR